MADVRPFAGIRFDREHVPDLGAALCGPFDVISSADRARLHAASDFNAVRLEAPDPSAATDPYATSAQTLEAWLETGALRQDDAAAYYAIRHRFEYDGREYTRTEIVGAVKLEPLSAEGPVRPHEATRTGPKEDRLKLMQATNANLSPIMLLYRDPGRLTQALDHAISTAGVVKANLGGGESFDVAALSDPMMIDTIHRALEKSPLYIADGHHRYETALHHATTLNARGVRSMDAAHNFVMASIVEMDDPGLLSLPYHRLLRGLDAEHIERLRAQLSEHYVEERYETTAEEAAIARDAMASLEEDGAVFEVWGLDPGVRSTFRLRHESLVAKMSLQADQSHAWASLAPSLFRETILVPVLGIQEEQAERDGLLSFGKSAAEAIERVSSGESQVAIMPKAVPMDLFQQVADRGERLPPKSTYFHPKLATGLVFRRLQGEVASPAL